MFKLVAFWNLIAVAVARPGLLGAQTSLETIGTVVNSIPTAITHQSQTQIHSSPIVSSIIAPAISSIAAPTVFNEATPIISSQILSSQLIGGQEQILPGNAQLIGDQQDLLFGAQGSLIGGEELFLGDGIIANSAAVIGDKTSLIDGTGLAGSSIDASGLRLDGLRH